MTTLTHSEFFNLFGDETIRLENMIYLAGVLPSYDGGGVPSPLEDFFDNEVDDIVKAFHDVMPAYVTSIAMDEGEDDEFNEACIDWMIEAKMYGFLVQVATPVMKHGYNSSSYSWGHYNTYWVYCATLDDIAKHAVEWVNKIRADEKAKA